jgi:hypothetical protein
LGERKEQENVLKRIFLKSRKMRMLNVTIDSGFKFGKRMKKKRRKRRFL